MRRRAGRQISATNGRNDDTPILSVCDSQGCRLSSLSNTLWEQEFAVLASESVRAMSHRERARLFDNQVAALLALRAFAKQKT